MKLARSVLVVGSSGVPDLCRVCVLKVHCVPSQIMVQESFLGFVLCGSCIVWFPELRYADLVCFSSLCRVIWSVVCKGWSAGLCGGSFYGKEVRMCFPSCGGQARIQDRISQCKKSF